MIGMNPRLYHLALEVQTTQAGQSNIEHQAAGDVRKLAFQQLDGGFEQVRPQADRAKEAAERLAHRRVVVDHEDDRAARLALRRLVPRHDGVAGWGGKAR